MSFETKDPRPPVYLACDHAAAGIISPYLWGGTEFLLRHRDRLPEAWRATFKPHRRYLVQQDAPHPVVIVAIDKEILKGICHHLHARRCDVPDGWTPVPLGTVTRLVWELKSLDALGIEVDIWMPSAADGSESLSGS